MSCSKFNDIDVLETWDTIQRVCEVLPLEVKRNNSAGFEIWDGRRLVYHTPSVLAVHAFVSGALVLKNVLEGALSDVRG